MSSTSSAGPNGRARRRRAARRSPRRVSFPAPAAPPRRSCGTPSRAQAMPSARRPPRRGRAAPARAGGSGPASRKLELREARLRSFSVGTMKSPKSTGEVRTAVPTSTRRNPSTFGIVPRPRSLTTSQRSGSQVRGRRPERSVTQRSSPSTAPRPRKVPAIVLSRKRTSGVASPGTTPASACLAIRSSSAWSSPSAGRSNDAARTERCAAGISSTARPTLSSRATTVPARTVASMAAPAATPAAARSAVGARRAILAAASRSG